MSAVIKSAQEWLESRNQAFHISNELTQRWDERLTLNSLLIEKRFSRGQIHIIVHVLIKSTGERWGLCFESSRFQQEPLISVSWHDIDCVISNRQNGPVLVDNVQLMNLPKSCIPAVVWFQRIDEFYRFWPDALYFSSLDGFVSSFILRNRKTYSIGGFVIGSGNDESICQVVQGASEIVNYVPSDGEDRKVVDRQTSCAHKYLSALRIFIGEAQIKVLIPSGVQYLLEVTEVIFGPFDFYTNQNDSIIGGKWHTKES